MRAVFRILMTLGLIVTGLCTGRVAAAPSAYARWEDVFASARRPTYLWDAGTTVNESYYTTTRQVLITASIVDQHLLSPELRGELSGKTALLLGVAYPRSIGCSPGDMAFPGGLSVIRLIVASGAEHRPIGYESHEALMNAFRPSPSLFPLAFASPVGGELGLPALWPAGDTGPIVDCGQQVLGIMIFATSEAPRELKLAPVGHPSASVRFDGPKVRLMQEKDSSKYLKPIDAQVRYLHKAGSPRVEACFRFENLLPNNSIVGIRFRGIFLDAFGNVVYEEQFQFDGKVEPGGTTPANYCWYWESYSPTFDRLRGIAAGGTGSVRALVYGVALGTGVVVFFL